MMIFRITLLFSLVLSIQAFAQKGVYKYVFDEHAHHLDRMLTKHPEFMNAEYKTSFIDPVTEEKTTHLFHLLEYAAYYHQFKCVEVILKHLNDAKDKQATLDQALAEIIQHQNLHMIKMLVDAGADPNYVSEDYHGRSMIMEAIQYDDTELFKYLMTFKPNLDHIDKDGRTVFHIAATHDNDTIIDMLFWNAKLRDVRDSLGGTPLVYATYHCSMKNFLKFHDQSDNHVLTEDNEDLIHFAARNNVDTNVLHYVLDKDTLDINIQDNYGITPMMYALYNHLYNDNPYSVKILLKEDINTKLKDEQGYDMFHYAIDTQDLEIMELVYKKDPDLLDHDHIKFAKKIGAQSYVKRWLHHKVHEVKKATH